MGDLIQMRDRQPTRPVEGSGEAVADAIRLDGAVERLRAAVSILEGGTIPGEMTLLDAEGLCSEAKALLAALRRSQGGRDG